MLTHLQNPSSLLPTSTGVSRNLAALSPQAEVRRQTENAAPKGRGMRSNSEKEKITMLSIRKVKAGDENYMERKSEGQSNEGLAKGRWMLEAPRELAVGRAAKKRDRVCGELRRAETKPVHKECVKFILTWMRYCSKGRGGR